MNFPLLTKLLFTFSSLGGTAIGGYFATTIAGNEKLEIDKEKGEKELKEEVESKQKQDKNGQTEDVGKAQHIGLINSEDGDINKHSSSTNYLFQQQKSNEASDTTFEKETLEEEKDLIRGGERWDDFLAELESKGDYGFSSDSLEIDEKESEKQYVVVADYVKYKSYSQGDEVCEQWYLETNKPKKRQKNQCDSFAKKESWGTRSPHYQPLVWISLVENYAETILKDYGLISGNTKYKTSNGTWETGPWSCTIEKSLDNLLVSCDFYENKQIT
ncbi:hypothetical protein [Mycoplasma suis]|uniref:Uncharacterized protein n=1 Tax=Mycoplasma suis (strain Illinois) TaxID=768700 RepID=F0QQM7_MYCSL|nr:hypothetical protein [Mycoplasma suis]ADX97797.1 hypothetical protein MSU_0253 [Mycoplasma suis str. Illinois]